MCVIPYHIFEDSTNGEPEEGRVLPIMAYTGPRRRPSKGVPFFMVHVYQRVGISLVEVNERVGKFVILVCRKAQKVQKMHGCKKKVKKTFWSSLNVYAIIMFYRFMSSAFHAYF